MLCKTVDVVVVVIIFHAAKKSEAGGVLLVLRDTRASSTASPGFTGVGQCKEDSFLKREEDMDFGEFGTALHSRFFFLPDIPCSFVGSGFRLDASRLKIQFVFPESQTWTQLRQYHFNDPVLHLLPEEGKLILQLESCSRKELILPIQQEADSPLQLLFRAREFPWESPIASEIPAAALRFKEVELNPSLI